MSKETYLFGIARMDVAEDLHATRREALDDTEISQAEYDEISQAVDRRFGFLNRRATPPVGRYVIANN